VQLTSDEDIPFAVTLAVSSVETEALLTEMEKDLADNTLVISSKQSVY